MSLQACNQDVAGFTDDLHAAEKEGDLGLDEDDSVTAAAPPAEGHGVEDIDGCFELAHPEMFAGVAMARAEKLSD